MQVPGTFTPNERYKHIITLTAIQPVDQMFTSRNMAHSEESVSFLCCVPKGHVAVTACTDKGSFSPGDQVDVLLSIDTTESEVDLEFVSLNLTQSMQLTARDIPKTNLRTLETSHGKGAPKGTTTEMTISLVIPAGCEDSTHTSMIWLQYKLEVILGVPWSANVSVDLPIHIMGSQLPTYQETVFNRRRDDESTRKL
jgi:hypothetical protein